MLKTIVSLQVFVTNEVFVDNEIDGIEGVDKSIKKSGKLSKSW